MKAPLVIIALLFVAPAWATDKVPVYVFTAQDPSGLIDVDQDQRKRLTSDVIKRLKRSKRVRVVEGRENAVLILEVGATKELARRDNLAGLVNTLNTLAGGLQAMRPKEDERPTETYRIGTLTFRDYTTELHGRYGKEMVLAIEQWVKLNRTSLLQVTP